MSRKSVVYFTVLKNRKTNVKVKRQFIQYTGRFNYLSYTKIKPMEQKYNG